MPQELTCTDDNDQFLYYNNALPKKDMLAPRTPDQVGNPMALCHLPRARKGAATVVNMLRLGKQEAVRISIPNMIDPNQYVVHDYRGMHNKKGEFKGVNEQVYDMMPYIKWYLAHTGQKLVKDPKAKNVDTFTSASQKQKPKTDTHTSASKDDPDKGNDSSSDSQSSASKKD